MRKKKRKLLSIVSFAVLIFGLIGCTKTETESQDEISSGTHDVSVSYINVGKGDSILVQVDGNNYLIDSGLEENSEAVLNALELKGVDKISGLFITHTHKDHIGGVTAVAESYEIDTMYRAEISENKKNGENKIDNLAAENNLSVVKLNAGDKIELADGVYFDVIGPLTFNEDDDNDNSLVMKLKVNGKTFLFTGDMQFAEEQTLMDAGVDLSADILKVGNHGNKDATSDEFAAAVSPEYSIISTDTTVDTNSANKRVISALSKSTIYITEDYDGGITFNISGTGNIEIDEF